MLRHQIVILRRKSPHPRLTAFDRIRLLAAAGWPTWRRTVAIVQPETPLLATMVIRPKSPRDFFTEAR
jgi:hypothetical protein